MDAMQTRLSRIRRLHSSDPGAIHSLSALNLWVLTRTQYRTSVPLLQRPIIPKTRVCIIAPNAIPSALKRLSPCGDHFPRE